MQCDAKRPTLTIDVDHPPICERLLLRDVLSGHLSRSLRKCSTHRLETLLLKVLQLQEGAVGSTTKPVWWPDDVLPYNDIHSLRHQVNNFIMNWHTALSIILESCVQFYKDTTSLPAAISGIDNTTSTTSTTNWSSTQTPTTSSTMTSTNTHLVPIDCAKTPRVILRDILSLSNSAIDANTSNISSCSTNGQEVPIIKPYVLLKDILKSKYPILEKQDFMNFLNLQSSPSIISIASSSQQPEEVVSKRYPCKIPFSSDCGKKLLVSKRYLLNKHSYTRKRNWTESYLRNDKIETTSAVQTFLPPMVPFKQRRKTNLHLYKFPQRQHRQHLNAMHRLKKAFCKPIEVHLKKMNVSSEQLKQLVSKVIVRVDRTEVDKFLEAME